MSKETLIKYKIANLQRQLMTIRAMGLNTESVQRQIETLVNKLLSL